MIRFTHPPPPPLLTYTVLKDGIATTELEF